MKNNQNIDPDKAAFSMAPHDEEAYAPMHTHDPDGDNHDDGFGGGRTAYGGSSIGYGGASAYTASSAPMPYGPDSVGARSELNPFDDHSDYRPSTGTGTSYAPPSAQDDYEEEGRPAQFPVAHYDRGA